MKLEPNHCQCGAEDSVIVFELADWNFGNSDAQAQMRRCLACGSLFPDRFPEFCSLAQAYHRYYTAPVDRRGLRRLGRMFLDQLQGDLVQRHTPVKAETVLDFGCGSGEFLVRLAARRPALRCFGTDLTQPQGTMPRSYEWIPLDRIEAMSHRFDHITLSHVIEHVRDARQTLALVRHLLAPGGTIWIATPNADSFLFSLLAGRARDADFPRHRQIFSATALERLLAETKLSARRLPAPPINVLLNLSSGMANRKKPPLNLGAQPPSLRQMALATVQHLVRPGALQAPDSPELILLARAA